MPDKDAKERTSVHRYRVKRDCVVDRLYTKGEEVDWNVETEGVPPHHFEPLDGGPVGKAPKGMGYMPTAPKPVTDDNDPDGPTTLKELQDRQGGGGPIRPRGAKKGRK